MVNRHAISGLLILAALSGAKAAEAATYEVGPGKPYANLKAVASLLSPGDVVKVMGDATYAGDIKLTKQGTSAQKITIQGVRVNGKRPVLSGGTNTIELAGDHYVFEGFEVTQGSMRCVFHHAHDVLIRDTAIHDCPAHGLLGADSGSGSLTLDSVEVYKAGQGTNKHPIYMATDETEHPGAVFRMQHCYVHDALGGHAVKSRAERNEIYANWIEGAYYRELELIAPDGQDPGLKREDSDVVGNVINHTGTFYSARVGSDGTGGSTNGRYRFVNNTFLLSSGAKPVIEIFQGIESLEMHNNAFYRMGGAAVTILEFTDVTWASGKAVMAGVTNWAPTGSQVPMQWTGTIFGANPKFAAIAPFDLRPAAGSPLLDKATAAPPSPVGYGFPSPLAAPDFVPPVQKVEASSSTLVRKAVGALDIGAFEGAGLTLVEEGSAPVVVKRADKHGEDDDDTQAFVGDDEGDEAGISCAFEPGRRAGAGGLAIGLAVMMLLRRGGRRRALS